VAVFRVGGELHAIDGTCCHRGGPLGEGTVDGPIVSCPWHGWRFDVRTGQCVANPGKVQARYAVKEVDGHIVVEIP
jgi:nitrite reductase/ring-hydroxylating ferredoxin subunit